MGAYLSKWVLGEGAYSGVGAYSIIYGTINSSAKEERSYMDARINKYKSVNMEYMLFFL